MSVSTIVIGLADDIADELAKNDAYDRLDLEHIAGRFCRKNGRLSRLYDLLIDEPGLRTSRVIEDGPVALAYDPNKPAVRTQVALEDAASTESGSPVATLVGLFVLEYAGDAKQLLRRLRALIEPDPATGKPDLETAYLEQEDRPASATVAGEPPPLTPYSQDYLTAAGINLPFHQKGGEKAKWGHYDGKGIGFIDIEGGWYVDHDAFDARVREQKPNELMRGAADHGTEVLGIVLARGEKSLIRGIAPSCTLKGLYALVDEKGPRERQTETAITLAATTLCRGDVLLLELATSSDLPVETKGGVFRAIQLAVARGIIVIEPAGNAPGTLEKEAVDPERASGWTDSKVEARINGIPDSGAIIVSGCIARENQGAWRPSHDPRTRGGKRIDCCAWSDNVVTSTGPGPSTYTTFSHTSAAAAIIAGLAIIVQQAAKHVLNGPLTPARMRELFRDSNLGTRVQSADPQDALVYNMPDACKLFKKLEEDARSVK